MSDGELLMQRDVWLVCRDTPADDALVTGGRDVAIHPSPRQIYERLRRRLPAPGEADFWCSPARRAQQTASRLLPEARWESHEAISPRLFGRWEGLHWDDIRARDSVHAEAFWREYGTPAPPGGESMQAVQDRWRLLAQMLQNRQDWQQAVLVTHPDIIRTALCHVLDCRLTQAGRLAVSPLSITRLSFSFVGWRLEEFNARG
jgi:broad specificity phosphatase PhoE